MGDMSKPEYVTTDWIADLKWDADQKRIQAKVLIAEADQIDKCAREFEARVRDHKKWSEVSDG